MSTPERRLEGLAAAIDRIRREYETGTRTRVVFSCGCEVKFRKGKCVGVSAGKGCHIEEPKHIRRAIGMGLT